MKTKTNVVVKLQFEGIHSWPQVVEHHELESVHFLAALHRHIFYVTAKKTVSHADRDVEIIMLKRNIQSYLHRRYFTENANALFLKNASCEMIAEELLKYFGLDYCEVLEDNENGAEVYAETPHIDTEVIIDGSVKLQPDEWSVTTNTAEVQVNYTYKPETGQVSI
jgi:hypothetical protein